MTRDEILDRLKREEAELKRLGVRHAALFGSRARGDARADSDTDILVEFDPSAALTPSDFDRARRFIVGLFDGPVDVVSRHWLDRFFRPSAEAEARYAF